ncbi:glycoprotein-N-acetylgalactosamine 3-beta-galactosyltransferase 1-B [Copidosoma floridanum]|uniref:glycoprotein-N-acetylgalactosamine 3-beta-galactosyltransferase 1-B n=1 Tax=Copidosoma floridanum TaxID=29053 RepID=UPI0006C9415B|nr:glycoprotein-N-acetylgalactosamine 3-beta-galactosyltransferase 1-B [Copidosoma floridanum]
MNVIILRPSLFFVGFLIGIITVFSFNYAGRIFGTHELQGDHSKTFLSIFKTWSKYSRNYNAWRQKQNVDVSLVNLDDFYYGQPSQGNKATLESEWLIKKVPVTCVVFVEKLKLATTIEDTWGRHCNQLLFFSRYLSDAPVINLNIKYTSSWQLLCEVMRHVWKTRDRVPLNWLIFVNDDTFVVLENLRHMLAPLDHEQYFYLGHPVVLWGNVYNVAQAGYVLSYGILQRLIKIFDTSAKCAAGGKYWKKEDFYLGKHLSALGIQPADTRDAKQRGTFHGFSLNVLLWGVAKPDSYYTKALYPPGRECCSDRSVTFSVGEGDKVRTINYLLYHLRVFGGGSRGNKAAPTPVPEDEVWKIALREEFNLTDVDDITSEEYFQMWRKKYSEPEMFLARNFRGVAEP